jgi:hypothetical protein
MPKKSKPHESLWSPYLDYECEIHQYCFGTDPNDILEHINMKVPIEEHEWVQILRMLGFDPDSVTVWIGVSKEDFMILGKRYRAGQIIAGDGKTPRSRFGVIH